MANIKFDETQKCHFDFFKEKRKQTFSLDEVTSSSWPFRLPGAELKLGQRRSGKRTQMQHVQSSSFEGTKSNQNICLGKIILS